MAAGDPADTHGHTHATAALQEPDLDLNADPASETQPATGETVLAQSAAEVQAQIDNFPGGAAGSGS
jgi:hypothetical protein